MIALITPTGARSKQIKLCAEWMRRQTYDGAVLWVIVDDCIPVTTDCIPADFRKNWVIEKVYPKPVWKHGENTQARNLLAAIGVVRKYTQVTEIFIIEDDDYYTPQYIDVMHKKLQGFNAAAQVDTLYYNVQTHVNKRHNNKKHGSLFQTGFVSAILPVFENAVKGNSKFIDIYFWHLIGLSKVNLFSYETDLAIGMKGMPGRGGIGNGHRMRSALQANDKSGRITGFLSLKHLIGMNYLSYL